ncbi:MAG: class I tRNA ligase family protein, partial [Verrucomicrobiota bacterium]
WRSKTPIIFRAMDQWFININHVLQRRDYAPPLPKGEGRGEGEGTVIQPATSDAGPTFRQSALQEIDRVKWIPDWGINRIKGAVESRPDWCISRQRTWGVPIPAFYDANSEPILDARIVRNVAALVEKQGSNVWFATSAADLWKQVKPADWTGPEAVAKSADTLDVWIDSGSSSRAVTAQRPELRGADKAFQADVYLEGSDQHRGWFQSSLLISLAGNGAAPFKTVLTHGFMVDADREKISKSKQAQAGYEKPQTAEAYVKKWGADIVRLWVASQDYRNDIVVSEERISKVAETYRGIRNTLRYQLSNLYDFDPAKHSVPDDQLTGLDRWILGEFAKLEADVLKAYDAYEFHVVYQRMSQFSAVELSAMYHDFIKDRMYTNAANSSRRRSSQTALHRMVKGLCQMLSPILAYTADEAWEFVPGVSGSVHEGEWKSRGVEISSTQQETWQRLFELRGAVLLELEKVRQGKTIGKALEAETELKVPREALNPDTHVAADWVAIVTVGESQIGFRRDFWSESNLVDLKEILSISRIDKTAGDKPYLEIVVRRASGQKCERCWHWETDVGTHAEHPTLCGRCVQAVEESPVA